MNNQVKMMRAALAVVLAVSLALLGACGGGADKNAAQPDASADTGKESAAIVSGEPEPSPSTDEEAKEVEEVNEAIDSGDFPYTVTLGPGWTVKASVGGAVIVEKENGLTLSLQHTVYGEEGITLDKLEESIKDSDIEPTNLTRGKVGDYDALIFNTKAMSDEGMPAARVAYVIAEDNQVIGISLGGKAGEDPASIQFTDADVDAAFSSIASSFRVK